MFNNVPDDPKEETDTPIFLSVPKLPSAGIRSMMDEDEGFTGTPEFAIMDGRDTETRIRASSTHPHKKLLYFEYEPTIKDLLDQLESRYKLDDCDVWWRWNDIREDSEGEQCLNELPSYMTLKEFVKNHTKFKYKKETGDGYYGLFFAPRESAGRRRSQEYNSVKDDPDWTFSSEKSGPIADGCSSVAGNVGSSASVDDPSSDVSESQSRLPQMRVFTAGSNLIHQQRPRYSGEVPALEQMSPRPELATRVADDVYVGLVNQAMTCYLNSLVQTLFMTPEFRNALYNWEYTGSKEEQTRSIPYQLQKLFVLLQTSVNRKTALETKELTKSFGWDSSHAWDQHDVQELCRVMFDALELKWRRTNQATVITKLYQGNVKDYVKCLECLNENAKNDVFLDLPLAIKPFGAHQAYRSVEEALEAFVQPEVLDGTNQYNCEKCGKKVNAHKGLKITKFPYLLTIQLKRFDFDYTTMHRIKLNDRMTFPDLLDLNSFIEPQESPADVGADDQKIEKIERMEEEPHPHAGGESGLVEDDHTRDNADESPHSNPTESTLAEASAKTCGDSDDEGICVDGTIGGGNSSAGSPIDADEDVENSDNISDPMSSSSGRREQTVQETLKIGPHLYELFSIMVHSGSASGGHYYAYIRNLDTKIWYCFNDQVVTRASMEDIRKTFGGTSSGQFTYSTYASSTNAYMLMYRQVDPERNLKLPTKDKLPDHIKRMLDKLQLEDEEQRVLEEHQRSLIRVRIHVYHPDDGRLLEKEFEIFKHTPVRDVVALAHDQMELGAYNIPVELCRLVRFTKSKETMDTSFDDGMKPISAELAWSYMTPDLLLEVAPRPNWFQPYNSSGITLKVYMVDVEKGHVQMPKFLLYATKDTLVGGLKESIADYLDLDSDSVRGMKVVLDHYTRKLQLLDSPTRKLSDEDMWGSVTIFVECGNEANNNDEGRESQQTEDPSSIAAFRKSRCFTILDQFKNTIQIPVTLPTSAEYELLGYTPPSMTAVASPLDDVRMCSAENSPLPIATSEQIVADGSQGNGVRLSLPVQQTEESSTASGSTQYVTPATSRSPSSEHLAVSLSSQTAREDDNIDALELDMTMSGGASPSPQVSPDVSLIGSNIDDEPPFQRSPPSYYEEPIPPLFDGVGDAGFYHPPEQRFDESLSKIDVDSPMGTEPAAQEGAVSQPAWGTGVEQESSIPSPEKIDYYFNVVSKHFTPTPIPTPVLMIDVDKRMLLTDFIQKISDHIGVGPDQFKLYKVYSGGGEYECSYSLTTTVDSAPANGMRVKLGRPLKEGEAVVKFLRFEMNDLEAFGKHLFDIALTKLATGAEIKRECQILLKRHCGLDVPIERIRLRENANGHMDIFHDGSTLTERYTFFSNDLYLQILEEPETATTLHHTAIFLRRWCPSTLSLGPVQEIVLSPMQQHEGSTESRLDDMEFFTRVSQLSNIPLKHLQFSSGTTEGTFPFECGKLKLLENTRFFGLPADYESTHQHSSSQVSNISDMNSEGDARKQKDDQANIDEGNADHQQAGCSTGPYPETAASFQFRRSTESYGWGVRGFTVPHDGLLVYYRDANEQPKILNDDERKELQIRDNARLRKNQTSYSWRKERALKIYTEISSSLADDLD